MFQELPKLKFDTNRRRVKTCPCGKSNKDGKFAPYKGFEDKGYCHSCGQAFLPALPTKEKDAALSAAPGMPRQRPMTNPKCTPSEIPFPIFRQSRSDYGHNNFVASLRDQFDARTVKSLIERYHIGTTSHWPGGVIFWYIDIGGRIRAGKIMLYNPHTGKRVKEKAATWVHSILNLEGFVLGQCLFGEHLLKSQPMVPVALVEGEKTAIIASAYFPQFIWLASGGMGNFSAQRCRALAGRRVVVFPDLNGHEIWTKKATEIALQLPGTRFTISNFLYQKTGDKGKTEGLDLADYLVKFGTAEFRTLAPGPIVNDPPAAPGTSLKEEKTIQNDADKCENKFPDPAKNHHFNEKKQVIHLENWDSDIAELEEFFQNLRATRGDIVLDSCSRIIDFEKFVESHLAVLRTNNGNRKFLPFLDRLRAARLNMTFPNDLGYAETLFDGK